MLDSSSKSVEGGSLGLDVALTTSEHRAPHICGMYEQRS